MLGELTNHLWQSTLFAAIAGPLTFALRSNRAQVRYWLWFSASLKFFVPFALLMSLGSHLQWTPAARPITPVRTAFSMSLVEIAQPFPEASPFVPSAPRRKDWSPAILTVWVSGFAAISLMRFRSWRRVRAALRSSAPMDISAPVEIRSSPGLLEPGIVGFLRPILLLPAGIEQHLTPPQLEAVLAHELCHVRRRDNLASAIHMIVEAVFWFHPLVWWIGARLVEERERACDEEVLRIFGEPRAYAEGILNVCKLYVESPLACVSGVTGSDIKKRIEAIMTNRVVLNLNFAKKLLLAAAGLLVASGPLIVGLLKAQNEAPLAFDVASVKRDRQYSWVRRPWTPNVDCAPIGQCGVVGNRFTEQFASLDDLLMDAYKVRRYQIAGLPDWGDTGAEVYDVDARSEPGRTLTLDQARRMLQTLLADRFHLRAHHETRDLPVYALIVAKNGPKLKPAQEPCLLPGATMIGPDGVRKTANVRAPPGLSGWSHVPELLADRVDRPVIDKSGLEEPAYCMLDGSDPLFSVLMALGPGNGPGRGSNPQLRSNIPDADTTGPSVFDLVEDKWGLKLEKQKGPADILVIDHVERPSEN